MNGMKSTKEMRKNRGLRPTRRQKQVISQHRLIPENWLVLSATPEQLELLNKKKGTTRIVTCG
ncbi:DUF6906 family protein [Paenibacillus sp. IHBB 3054]|uniref:DUF6906 family protein n=1 Tax=Paenibacillus sp. IHBB 3054 TaxID=3425689 RepID=UPI003F668493